MKRSSHESSITQDLTEMPPRSGELFPGSFIHTDQYEFSVGGRTLSFFGKEKVHEKYKGGTIFVDFSSTYLLIHHQLSLCASNTLHGKHGFESFADLVEVNVLKYHVDNHIFNSAEYLQDCKDNNQEIHFCGVGTHHLN